MNIQEAPIKARIAVGGIRYEVNSFAGGRGGYADFARHYVRRGDEVLAAEANTELAGALAAGRRSAVEFVGVLDAVGGAGPVVEHAAYEDRLKAEYLDRLAAVASHVDGVYLPLHGAMATDGCWDVEGDLLAGVREVVGPDLPVVVSHDLHGAPTERLARNATALLGYRTCPHVDFVETGARSLRLLTAAIRSSCHPELIRRAVPMIMPAETHDTNQEPMRSILEYGFDQVDHGGVLDVSVFAAQPWLDTPRTSTVVTCVVDNAVQGARQRGRRLLDELAARLWAARGRFTVAKTPVAAAVELVRRHRAGRGPLLLADGGDSPSAGATGDSTDLLAALLSLDGPGPVLATVADPAAAARLHEAGVGVEVTCSVGGRLSPEVTRPVTVTGTVQRCGDGRYLGAYPAIPMDVGKVALLRSGPVLLVVTERPAMMLDQHLYRHLGLDPATARAVQVKSAGGFRALWEPIAAGIVMVDTLGASDSNLARLPFRHVPRPLWPLDDDATAELGVRDGLGEHEGQGATGADASRQVEGRT